MDIDNDEFPCIGVCTPEPLSGACEGCGRPLEEPAISAYQARKQSAPSDQPQPPDTKQP